MREQPCDSATRQITARGEPPWRLSSSIRHRGTARAGVRGTSWQQEFLRAPWVASISGADRAPVRQDYHRSLGDRACRRVWTRSLSVGGVPSHRQSAEAVARTQSLLKTKRESQTRTLVIRTTRLRDKDSARVRRRVDVDGLVGRDPTDAGIGKTVLLHVVRPIDIAQIDHHRTGHQVTQRGRDRARGTAPIR